MTENHSRVISALLNGVETFPNDPFSIPAPDEYLNGLLAVPDGILETVLPASNVSIRGFLRQSLPPLSHELVHPKAITLFSLLPPNREIHTIVSYPVPPKTLVRDLQSVFGRHCLMAISQFQTFDTKILGYLYGSSPSGFTCTNLHGIHRGWASAVSWLKKYADSKTASSTTFKEALQRVEVLPVIVNSQLQEPNVSDTTHELSRLLSDEGWLSGTLLVLMTTHLNTEHAQKLSRSRIMILDTMFMINVVAATSKDTYAKPSWRGPQLDNQIIPESDHQVFKKLRANINVIIESITVLTSKPRRAWKALNTPGQWTRQQ